MPSALPEGDPAPEDGALPPEVAVGAHARNFGVYVHVPYCRVRCGYCDFNTYTASELGGTSRGDYAAQVEQEDIERIWKELENQPGIPVTVDLEARTVECGGFLTAFQIDDDARRRLLAGLDDIDATLTHADAIAEYEARRPAFRPTTLPARSADA